MSTFYFYYENNAIITLITYIQTDISIQIKEDKSMRKNLADSVKQEVQPRLSFN